MAATESIKWRRVKRTILLWQLASPHYSPCTAFLHSSCSQLLLQPHKGLLSPRSAAAAPLKLPQTQHSCHDGSRSRSTRRAAALTMVALRSPPAMRTSDTVSMRNRLLKYRRDSSIALQDEELAPSLRSSSSSFSTEPFPASFLNDTASLLPFDARHERRFQLEDGDVLGFGPGYSPDDLLRMYSQAVQADKRGDSKQSERLLKKLAIVNPTDGRVWSRLAR
jgi:hypothetical protein